MDASMETDFKMDCITTDFVIDPYRTANENMKLKNIGQVVSSSFDLIVVIQFCQYLLKGLKQVVLPRYAAKEGLKK